MTGPVQLRKQTERRNLQAAFSYRIAWHRLDWSALAETTWRVNCLLCEELAEWDPEAKLYRCPTGHEATLRERGSFTYNVAAWRVNAPSSEVEREAASFFPRPHTDDWHKNWANELADHPQLAEFLERGREGLEELYDLAELSFNERKIVVLWLAGHGIADIAESVRCQTFTVEAWIESATWKLRDAANGRTPLDHTA